jgi:outer membrane receptor protein involved in Fe transport
LAVFHAETDDKIVFRQNSQRTSRAENIGATRTRGLEAELAADLPAGFDLRANGTWQRAEDTSGDPAYDGKRLPFLPDGEVHGRLARASGVWRPWLEVAWLSANYRDRYNNELNKAPARTLLNLGLTRRWTPTWLGAEGRLSASAEVVNLTNNDVYDVEGYPLPGRSWHLALKVER